MAGPGLRAQVFSRRVALIAGGELTLLGMLIGRLYQLQVIDRDRYAMLAEDNRVAMRLLAPPRGRILDRYGVPLALNRQNYRLVVTAEQTGSVAATLDALAAIVTLTDADRRRVTREVSRRRRFVPVTVREDLSWDEVARSPLGSARGSWALWDSNMRRVLQNFSSTGSGTAQIPAQCDHFDERVFHAGDPARHSGWAGPVRTPPSSPRASHLRCRLPLSWS